MGITRRSTAGLLFSVMSAAFFACLLLMAVQAFNAQPAEAHRLEEKAVRNGKIHYASEQGFDFINARNWAVGQWNRLEPIDITRDTRRTDMDLRFEQYSGGAYAKVDAYYNYRPPDVDKILFNTKRWKPPRPSLGEYDREAVAVHELGHALNLRHPRSTPRYWRKHSIMYKDAAATRFHSWQGHERNDYNNIW